MKINKQHTLIYCFTATTIYVLIRRKNCIAILKQNNFEFVYYNLKYRKKNYIKNLPITKRTCKLNTNFNVSSLKRSQNYKNFNTNYIYK